MSYREDCILKFESFCFDNRLSEVYGCVYSISPDKKYRSTTFCRARVLDGEYRVYGPKFHLIKFTTRYNSLPHNMSKVFKSFDDVIEFMQAAFVDYNNEKTNEILDRR